MRPLKMNYVHNKADVIRAFIFVQTELKGFAIYSPVEFNYNNDERKMNIENPVVFFHFFSNWSHSHKTNLYLIETVFYT